MLRPEMVVNYAKFRAAKGFSDFSQLVDGVNVGGHIIVGGDTRVQARLQGLMQQARRLGTVIAVANVDTKELDPARTYSFDVMAIAQMIMIAKNEAFHDTITQAINVIQDLAVNRGQKIETALQVLREKADEIGHL